MEALGCIPLLNGAGMFVWAKVPNDILSSEQYADDILEKSKVFITPGSIFGSKGDRYLRISLCSNESQFNTALERVQAYMQNRNPNSLQEISMSI
jgi:aspartate/methionine/tyrosine aminotransferase